MMLRPGTQYIAASENNNTGIHIPFVFSTTDTAILQITDENMRVYVDDEVITRPAVTAAVTNGTFDTNVTNWTDADESGATSQWVSGGYLGLLGTGFNSAIRRQQVTVNESGTAHALRILIERGPVTLKVGSSSGDDDYANEVLGTGVHSLAFTPSGNFHIEFSSSRSYTVLVDSVSVESSGAVDIPVPWVEDDLSLIRWDQSADVVFVACEGYQQRRIERRGTTSWSVVLYEPEDGPFRADNTGTFTLTPSATSGDITLLASGQVFTETNVGSLFRIGSIGQTVTLTVSGEDQFTDYIRVTGVDTSRVFNISVDVDGGWSGTVTVQRSLSEPGDWSDVSGLSYTADVTTTHDDGLDNQIAYYRIGVKTGNYSAGSAALTLSFGSGSNTGVVRITDFTSETSVSAVVLDNLGGTDASSDWAEGEWSDRRGFPSAVAFHGGRLAWGGKGKVILSVSDAFDSFNDEEGDANAINKNLGSGPTDRVNWMFSGARLVLGTDGREVSVRSNSLDDPLTQTVFGIRYPSSQGSAPVPHAVVDSRAIFVQRGGTRIYQLVYNDAAYEYESDLMSSLVPEIGEPSITRLAVQRQPDTRIHAVRSDGKVAILVNDPVEDVSCWVLYETDGEVEDAFVLPGEQEDQVYYFIKRTINGSTARYLEKWALESECQGGTLNKQADSFIIYSGPSTATITGLDHLEEKEVVVWAGGLDLSPDDEDGDQELYFVSGGQITLETSVTSAVIGLPYMARYKSSKLAYGAQMGTALTQRKRIDHLGMILYNTHLKGITYGRDFDEDSLDELPDIEQGTTFAEGSMHETYDYDMFEFNGEYNTDSRVCLQAKAPRHCTVLALVIGMATNEK